MDDLDADAPSPGGSLPATSESILIDSSGDELEDMSNSPSDNDEPSLHPIVLIPTASTPTVEASVHETEDMRRVVSPSVPDDSSDVESDHDLADHVPRVERRVCHSEEPEDREPNAGIR